MGATIPTADISALFIGLSDKVLARMIGRPHTTIKDCRQGRSQWRADDIMNAARESAEVRSRAIAYLKSLDQQECQR